MVVVRILSHTASLRDTKTAYVGFQFPVEVLDELVLVRHAKAPPADVLESTGLEILHALELDRLLRHSLAT